MVGRARRADLDPRALVAGLAPALADAPLRELGEGFDNLAWAVGDRFCLRVSKDPDPGGRRRAVERDAALLALAAAHVRLPTNEVVAANADEGALLLTLLAGPTADLVRPTDAGRVATTLARLVSDLAAVPLDAAAGLVVRDRPPAAWLADTAAEWSVAAPLLPTGEREAVDRFLARPAPEESARLVFSHNDLGDEHLVMAPDGRDVLGVIDWSDALLGDRARDLALVALDLGPPMLDLVLARLAPAPDPALRERALWFAARAGVEGVAYRATHARPSLPVARAALGRVLAARDRTA
ncbi:phosphotransferase family protein [Phycicoccus flavus]|uniref:Phosphotransferase n=1 Tax=Phycicoccus flavus TaxID=2502783 RepID=A0A8T6R8K0_9MICO|nr:phosphotransferase [Phycicoccus flavus]NHA69185.1 phosphotransferase [Phycicoccus flavus]